MPRPPRPAAPDRPDPEARLLAAVAERDTTQAIRLADRYTHRRGIDAFQTFLASTLTQGQGREAALWLAAVVRLDPQSPSPAEPLAPGVTKPGGQGIPEPCTPEPAFPDPWQLPEIHFGPVSMNHSEPCAVESSEATWLEDLAREEATLAAITSAPLPAGYSDPTFDNPAPTEVEPPTPADEVWVFGRSAPGAPSDADRSCQSLEAGAGFENPFAAFPLGDISFAEPPRSTSQSVGPESPDVAIDDTNHATSLIPRLKEVSLPAGLERRLPAPAPASLARLRSWLHDDALPEAS